MIERLEACTLPVSDLARSLSFYCEILGFEVVDETKGRRAILRAGDGELVLLSPEATASEPKFRGAVPGGAMAIHLRVGDPDQLWEAVHGAVSVLERLDDRDYGDRDFTIEDPDGYRLVLGRALA